MLLSHYLCLCSISPCIETAVLSNAGRLLCVLFRQGCTCWGNYSGRSIVEDEDDTGGKTRVGVRSESARALDFGVYFCAALLVFTYFLLVFICSFVCLGCKRLGWGSLACLSCLLIHVYGRWFIGLSFVCMSVCRHLYACRYLCIILPYTFLWFMCRCALLLCILVSASMYISLHVCHCLRWCTAVCPQKRESWSVDKASTRTLPVTSSDPRGREWHLAGESSMQRRRTIRRMQPFLASTWTRQPIALWSVS